MGEVKFTLKPVEEKTKRGSEKGDNTITRIVFDTSKQGLETVMRGYHEMALRFLWERDEEGFKLHVAKAVILKLSDMWPDATREALIASRKV